MATLLRSVKFEISLLTGPGAMCSVADVSLFRKQVLDYFSSFASHYQHLNEVLEDCLRINANFSELIRRYNNIDKANISDTPLNGIDNLKSKLLFNIARDLSENIQTLQTKSDDLYQIYEQLNRQREDIEKNANLSVREDIMSACPDFLPMNDLSECCFDCAMFFLGMSSQIAPPQDITEILSSRNIFSKSNLKVDTVLSHRIKDILYFTRHLRNQ